MSFLLVPCTSCRRHLRCTEEVCPFCRTARSPTQPHPASSVSSGRMSSLAVITFRAAAIGAALAACGGTVRDEDDDEKDAAAGRSGQGTAGAGGTQGTNPRGGAPGFGGAIQVGAGSPSFGGDSPVPVYRATPRS